MAWVVAINSNRNEKFSVKTFDDQQKVYVAFMRLINTLGVLGHCAIWKYIYHIWMEGVFPYNITTKDTKCAYQSHKCNIDFLLVVKCFN